MQLEPSIVQFEGMDLLVFSLAALIVGDFSYRRISFFQTYNIPSALIGGLSCSILVWALDSLNLVRIEFGTALRDLLLLGLFSTIGLSMKFRNMRDNVRVMLVLLALATAVLIFQNMLGSSVAAAFGYSPAAGLFAGSITFMGGHGTGVAWSEIFAERFGLVNAEQAALAFATLGLVAGGFLGGPLAELLIRRNHLKGAVPEAQRPSALPSINFTWKGVHLSMLNAGLAIAICVSMTAPLAAILEANGVTIPGFVVALFIGAVFTNVVDLVNVELDVGTNALISEICLQLFMTISIMSIQLSTMIHVAVPLVVVCVLQILMVGLFVYFTAFPILGRNYESAVLCAGFTGFSLGSSLIGLGIMRSVTRKYGPADFAFIVVPFVGSFLIDIVNSLVIQLYLASSVLE